MLGRGRLTFPMNTEAYSQAGSLGETSNLPREGRGVRNGHIGRQQGEVSFGASPPGMVSGDGV